MRAKLKGVKTFDFKGMRPRDGDVLVIKKWPGFSKEDHDLITKALNENMKANVVMFFVNSLSDIKLLGERQLNAVGLQRIKNSSPDVPEPPHAEGV